VHPGDEESLRTVLRREAERHDPDRAAMLRRLDRARPAVGRRHRARRPVRGVRPMAVAATVAALLVTLVGGRLAVGYATPAPSAPAAAGAGPSTATPVPARSSRSGPAAPAGRTPPVADGFLTGSAVLDPHSLDTWSQGNLTLTTTATITALDVTIRVAHTAGLENTGRWSSIPDGMTRLSVHVSAEAVLYRYTLDDGATLAPGHYVFAAQYHHAPARSAARDTWTASVRAGSAPVRLSGTF
jgi:hypothetical protein